MRLYVINANEHIKEKWTVGRVVHSVGALIVHSFFDQIPILITVFYRFQIVFYIDLGVTEEEGQYLQPWKMATENGEMEPAVIFFRVKNMQLTATAASLSTENSH